MGSGGKIFIYGASGHAKVVIDAVEKQGRYQIAFIVDDGIELQGQEFCGYRILGGGRVLSERSNEDIAGAIVAIGDNRTRMEIATRLAGEGIETVTAVHPSAQLGAGVVLGAGTVVMAGAVINSDSALAEHVIVNTRAGVDHDCSIAAGSHLAPGSTLCGSVEVGELTLVGAGATIIPNMSVGREVIIGAGSTVVRDIPDGATVVGTEVRIA